MQGQCYGQSTKLYIYIIYIYIVHKGFFLEQKQNKRRGNAGHSIKFVYPKSSFSVDAQSIRNGFGRFASRFLGLGSIRDRCWLGRRSVCRG